MVVRVALSGKLRSGKTTARQIFQKVAKEKYNIDLFSLPLATPIYSEAHAFYNRHGLIWTAKDRKLLEGIGEALNDKYPYGDKIVELYKQELESKEGWDIIIDDMRRITQADFLKEQGFTLVRLQCSDDIRKSRCEPGEWSEGAITDTELDGYKHFDHIITNEYESDDVGLDRLTSHIENVLYCIADKEE